MKLTTFLVILILGNFSPLPVESASLGDMISQTEDMVQSLQGMVSGPIGDELNTLANLQTTVATIKDKFLDESVTAVTGEANNFMDFLKNVTNEAADLGVDISPAIVGVQDQLANLTREAVDILTSAITGQASQTVATINKDIQNVNAMVRDIPGAPIKLSECLISLRPITCLKDLLKDLTPQLTIPVTIFQIVTSAEEQVKRLPVTLTFTTSYISAYTSAVQQLRAKVQADVDNIISGATTTVTLIG